MKCMKLRSVLSGSIAGLFIVAFLYQFVHVLPLAINSLQTLRFIPLSYQQRNLLHEDPLVTELDKKLCLEGSHEQKTCLVELPYSDVVKEGLGRHPLGGQWTYRIEKTDYNLYPRHVDWGYSRNGIIYRILFDYSYTARSEPLAAINDYPCIFRISSDKHIEIIKGTTHVP